MAPQADHANITGIFSDFPSKHKLLKISKNP
jgi:hypothetical protein